MSNLNKYLPNKYQQKPIDNQVHQPDENLARSIPSSKDLNPTTQTNSTGTTQTTNNNNSVKISSKNKAKQSPKKKKVIFLSILLFLLLAGTLTSLFLIKRAQDIRQQAAYPTPTITPKPTTKPTETPIIACADTGCATDDQCENGLICIQGSPDEGVAITVGICGLASLADECRNNRDYDSCCTKPTETPIIACADTGCATDDQCENGLICIQGSPDEGVAITVGICGLASLADECRNNRDYDSCCVEPTVTTTPSPTLSLEPTTGPTDSPEEPTTGPTDSPEEPTPVVTTVITTVGCNESCSENADCANISHICYEGFCRLDVYPTDVNCRLPDGETTIERAIEIPTETGFADWFNFLKIGLGALGLGTLLLLLF